MVLPNLLKNVVKPAWALTGAQKSPGIYRTGDTYRGLMVLSCRRFACGLTFRTRFRERLCHTGLTITELIMIKRNGLIPDCILIP
jgi:hypothetical protein